MAFPGAAIPFLVGYKGVSRFSPTENRKLSPAELQARYGPSGSAGTGAEWGALMRAAAPEDRPALWQKFLTGSWEYGGALYPEDAQHAAQGAIADAASRGVKTPESSEAFQAAYGMARPKDELKELAKRALRREGTAGRSMSKAAQASLNVQRQRSVAATLLGGAAQEAPGKRTVLGSG